jgi:predicted HTH transcriptional regulator
MSQLLTDLIAQGEGSRLDFKLTISSSARIARTLTAFANSSGGTILIGVADDGTVSGVASEQTEMERIEEATDFFIVPALEIAYGTVVADERLVLVIDVPESLDKPHYALDEQGNRTIYIRSRDKSVPTSKLIVESEGIDNQLLQSPPVKLLLTYLRQNDDVTPAKLAQMANLSDQRAARLLRELATQGLLLLIDNGRRTDARQTRYALKVS